MPKLWNDTIESHRAAVRDAVLDATASLVTEHGLLAVTMSQIAEETGIGRATLYKYFPDVGSILLAWHERAIAGHLEALSDIGGQPGTPRDRLHAVLEAYAFIEHGHHGSDDHGRHLHDPALSAVLHRGGHVAQAHDRLSAMIRDLIAEAARGGEVRDDTSPAELATYCLHALSAAARLGSKAAVHRLVEVTVSGLSP